MQKKTSLEEILDRYMRNGANPNRRLSLGEYRAKYSLDRTPEYAKGIREAFVSSRLGKNSGGAGESAFTGGFSGSGYSEYLGEKREDTLMGELKKIEDVKRRDEGNTYTGYLSYLRDYEKRQKQLAEEISDTLIRGNVADPRAAYSYAMSKGLDSESAKQVSVAVYELMRGMVLSSIAEKLSSFKLSEDGAVSLARGYGLIPEDIEYVRQLARERRGEVGASDNNGANDENTDKNTGTYIEGLENFTDKTLEEYLKELEDNADKVSSGK